MPFFQVDKNIQVKSYCERNILPELSVAKKLEIILTVFTYTEMHISIHNDISVTFWLSNVMIKDTDLIFETIFIVSITHW